MNKVLFLFKKKKKLLLLLLLLLLLFLLLLLLWVPRKILVNVSDVLSKGHTPKEIKIIVDFRTISPCLLVQSTTKWFKTTEHSSAHLFPDPLWKGRLGRG